MAGVFVPGPALFFVEIQAPLGGFAFRNVQVGVPVFLGTTKGKPVIEHSVEYIPIQSDIGAAKPFDYAYGGSDGMVSGIFNRFDYDVLNAIMSRPNIQVAEGINQGLDYGMLMGQEGATFELWVYFPRSTVPGMIAKRMVPGYHYHAAFLFGPEKFDPGTADLGVQLQFMCLRQFKIANTPNFVTFSLYDHDMGALVGKNIT